ncbi:hypothetical protein K490DRAFT_64192 [Saccharata proteae CBS 121410]|uniref:Endosomal peripheral membrane protein-like protein n=1 Tax=Saccharata proteae CBS 121410 TaxID=1314787 RepID=A0A6A5YBY1_9PEZI|nr:hypothetical protein K490DRAFT_64192 [Saccharata proteae CBS 121410]
MTAQILNSELANLIQDSKRKNPELRNAADRSLQELKALPATSEAQLAAGLDIQLKTLQALPSLLQNYSEDIRGELLSSLLQVCSSLQNAKNPAVSGTAAATLQQLVISTFEKVAEEDERSLQIPTTAEVTCDDGTIPVRPAAHDAYKVFRDICLLTEGGRPQSIRFSPISQAAGLELIESVLSNHGDMFLSHSEQSSILRTHLMPMIIRSLSERLSFSITLRILRVFNLVVRQLMAVLPSECEIALGLLNHMLDPDAAAPWKRALCMEIFRNLYSEPSLIIRMYAQFDAGEGKKSIIRDNLSTFVRLATEKPAVIGLGQQSTAPVGSPTDVDEPAAQAAMEAGAVAGIIGGAPTVSTVPGISTQWSSLRISCLDQLDKSEPPSLPETYIYSLVLTCINNFSESLARFILPLTVHNETKNKKKNRAQSGSESTPQATPGSETPATEQPKNRMVRSQSYRRRTVPVNPLELADNPAEEGVKMTAAAISDCWPAILATCSTFLNAALDADYYHALVRSIQKFTQIAGLLRLSTPRDAFLTTLGKAAVPPTIFSANVSNPKTPGTETPGLYSNHKGLLSVDSLVSQADKSRRSSLDIGPPTLSTRNLLCLRALLNLAIALGPTLESAWSIIFETLQQADTIMTAATGGPRDRRGGAAPAASLGSEVVAVQAAASRLFESTVDFPNDSFVQAISALCTLVEGRPGSSAGTRTPAPLTHQSRAPSFSGFSLKSAGESHVQDYVFALNKIGDLGALNASRLVSFETSESGWDLLIRSLVSVATGSLATPSVRLLAADVLSRLAQDMARAMVSEEHIDHSEIHRRVFGALQMVVHSLYKERNSNEDEMDETDIEVHITILDALKAVLDQCGDTLTTGWALVFTLIRSVFLEDDVPTSREDSQTKPDQGAGPTTPRQLLSMKLGRLAFGSVQLVCSDFLTAIPDSALLLLLDLLYLFCDQGEDLNISLTTITFFWKLSDYLHGRVDQSSLDELALKAVDKTDPNKEIVSGVKQNSIPALWLHLLQRTASITQDRRGEVRNGALHTILRIFDSYGDQLSPTSWNLCLRAIIFRLLESNIARHKTISGQSQFADAEDAQAWVETTRIILDGLVRLFTTYQEGIVHAPQFQNIWQTIIDFLREYVHCRSHSLNAAAYTAMTGLLSSISSTEKVDEAAISQALSMWLEELPQADLDHPMMTGNQEAFLAYVQSFKEIYRLRGSSLQSDSVLRVASNLRQCIADSDSEAYSADKDRPTPLQTEVIEVIRIIKTDIDGVPTIITKLTADFIALPFENREPGGSRNKHTFVALSKASMDCLQSVMAAHIAQPELFTQGGLLVAFKSLAIPIRLKYAWKLQGKSPTIWQKATTTFLNILGPAAENARRLSIKEELLVPVWEQVISTADGIAHADLSAGPSPNVVLEDEAFDIQSLTRLRDIITPSLGFAYIPSAIRRLYTSSLFRNSLIHKIEPGEIPSMDEEPLQDLFKVRRGRTYDPPPTERTSMAYFCLNELFSLVTVHDSSSERVKLAQAGAPYLILRAAIPIKAYIADQPLRGRMPQPGSQRKELIFILQKLRELEAEPKAIPEAPGVLSEHKKHLHRLFPLVQRATTVAGRDGEILDELVQVMEVVGDGFGV